MKRKLLWLTAGGLSLTAVVLIAMNRQALAQQSGASTTSNGLPGQQTPQGITVWPSPNAASTPLAYGGPPGQTESYGGLNTSLATYPPNQLPIPEGYTLPPGIYGPTSTLARVSEGYPSSVPPAMGVAPTYSSGIRGYTVTPNAPPATKGYYQDEAKIQQLLAEYQSAKDDAKRAELVEQITKAVTNQFDEKQKAREQELKALEEQLAKLKEKHTKRQQLRNDIIGDRVSQLVNNIDGLGWGNETSGSLPPLAGGIGFPGMQGPGMPGMAWGVLPGLPTPGVRYPSPILPGVAPWNAPPTGTQPTTTVPAPPARARQLPSQNNSTSVDPNGWGDAPSVRTRLLRDVAPVPPNASGLSYRRMQTPSQAAAIAPSLGALPVAETQPLPSLDRLPNPLSDLAVESPETLDGVAPLEALQPTDPLIIAEQPTLELPVAPALPSADQAPAVESPELPPGRGEKIIP
ncbi:MAG: hypothetical protein WCI02_10420 [Planctomycetota bacterium]